MAGNSDLAELDRATDGAIARRVQEIFLDPLPLNVRGFGQQAAGSPLLDQALLMISAVGEVDGLPDRVNSEEFTQTLERASASGSLTLLDFLEAVPGDTLTIEMGRFRLLLDRVRRQQHQGLAMVKESTAAEPGSRLREPGPHAVQRGWRASQPCQSRLTLVSSIRVRCTSSPSWRIWLARQRRSPSGLRLTISSALRPAGRRNR